MQIFPRRPLALLLFTASSLLLANLSLRANDDWTQWRGPTRDGFLADTAQLPTALSGEAGLRLVWEKSFGPSYSGPVVASGIVITTETVDQKLEQVTALDLETGEKLWTARWEGALSVPFFAKKNGDWIRSTPCIAGDRVFVGGIRDVLACLDLKSGEELWRVDLAARFKSETPAFGFASSPLVDGEAVYVQAGGGICKLNADTGETIWRTEARGGGMDSAFSSPVIETVGGVRQLVVQTRESICGLDLESSEVLWSQPIEAFRGMNILTPTIINNRVFTSAYGGRANLWEISRTTKSESALWNIKEVWDQKHQGYMSSPVQIGNSLYLHLRNTRFTCLNLETGEANWTTKPVGDYWSIVTDGKSILSLASDGVLRLIDPSDKEYIEVDQRKVADDSWAHLAVTGNKVIVRDLKGLKVFEFGQ